MRSLHLLLVALLLAGLALVPACSRDDDDNDGPVTPVNPGTDDALAGYWDAGSDAGEALVEVNDLWATFAALAADPDVPADSTLAAAERYAEASRGAAVLLRIWHDLESNVDPAKAQFGEDALSTALEVLEAAADAADTGAEALITSWQTLGGLASLRAALADPEGTVPVTGILAEALAARLAHRDALVTAAILDEDSRDGALPLDQLAGATPADRAAAYADLDDDDPIKLQCRAAVPGWDVDERDASLALLERAARGHLRLFANVGAGGVSLADLATHFTGALENDPTVHDVACDLRDGLTDQAITGEAMLVVRRRGQPDEMPRLAILAGTAAQVFADLPAGSYDILALASGWARDLACDVETADALEIPLRLSHLDHQTLVLEGIDGPAMTGAGMRVDLSAVAASTSGDPVQFSWAVRGGETESLNQDGADLRFTPAEAGTYTVTVTATDDQGSTCTDSTTVEVTSFAVEVFRSEFLIEQIEDFHFNPGEQDTLWLWVANRGDQTVVGTPSLTSRDGLDVNLVDVEWTLDAGRQTRWQVPVSIPTDWDQPTATLDFAFTSGAETLVQELEYRVDFYAELDYINSPQTSRVLTVSGTVANPTLEYAQLIVDRDRRHVYDIPLTSGVFEQVVILPGTDETRRMRLELVAESGNRRETATAGFMAAIAKADFRATLFWDTDGTDVDLWVTDPSGETCYYANQTTDSGLELDVDDVTGYGPENITGESDLPPGDYLVQVHYFSDHDTGLASHCTVMLTMHEGTAQETVEIHEQTISDGDVWDVATVSWDGAAVTAVVPHRRVETIVRPQHVGK